MVTTFTPSLRKLVLIAAFALFAVLLGWGIIMTSQAATVFGAVFLALVFVLIIFDAGRMPGANDEPDDDDELEWR